MGLTLKIENETRLPDGGPLIFRLSGARGADIGRDAHLDWTLPDPSRFISGKHCEIRYKDSAYWLSDVSTNGTFLNNGDRRMQSPHRLRSGDRLTIGQYLIAVEVDGGEAVESYERKPESVEPEDLWGGIEGAAPPLDPRDLRPVSQSKPIRPDFLEWAVDVPNAPGIGFVARPTSSQPHIEPVDPNRPLDWASGVLPASPAPEPPAQVPAPRRSIWVNPGPAGPWDPSQAALSESDEMTTPEHAPEARVMVDVARATSNASGQPQDAFLRGFAKGAGVPVDALSAVDVNTFAERLGRMMLLVADNLKQLLSARSQTKRIARSANQTMIQALDNNPLKFSPSAAEALRIMFGPSTGSYLDADKALQQSFDDLKAHQIKTFSAMQHALQMLIEDLDPKAIEDGLGRDQGLAAVLGSRKARLWDVYESRWKTKTKGSEGGLLELYLSYFAECYDRAPGHGTK